MEEGAYLLLDQGANDSTASTAFSFQLPTNYFEYLEVLFSGLLCTSFFLYFSPIQYVSQFI